MIGILTFFQYINYGTFLQAYALQNYLLQQGYENELIDYRTAKNLDNELQVVLESETGNPDIYSKVLSRIKTFKQYQKRLKTTRHFFNREELSTLHYNTIIIGSDQIWCYTKEWAGLETPYFSDYLNADKVIAYAASMGSDKYDQPHPRSVQRLMKNFAYIGARDTNTYKFASLYNPNTPQMVVDPTLLYDFQKECEETNLRNYLLFYSDGLHPSDDMIASVKAIARENQLKIISVGKQFDWCDKNVISISPFKYIGYIKNASFVFTCMFHGLMFCIKYKKQFAMFMISDRQNKSLDFLTRVGIPERIISDGESLINAYHTPIDYNGVYQYLDKEINASRKFLKMALEENETIEQL